MNCTHIMFSSLLLWLLFLLTAMDGNGQPEEGSKDSEAMICDFYNAQKITGHEIVLRGVLCTIALNNKVIVSDESQSHSYSIEDRIMLTESVKPIYRKRGDAFDAEYSILLKFHGKALVSAPDSLEYRLRFSINPQTAEATFIAD